MGDMVSGMATDHEAFTKRLSEELSLRGWSQAEFARRLGMSPQAITHYVKGRGRPSWGTLKHMEDELGLRRGDLLELWGHDTERDQHLPTVEQVIKADFGILPEDKRALLRIVAGMRRSFEAVDAEERIRQLDLPAETVDKLIDELRTAS